MKVVSKTNLKETEIGLIPEEWEVLSVADIGRVITGKTPPTIHQEYYGDDFMFVKIPDMSGSMYITNSESKLSQAGADYLGKAKLPKDSVMVSCIATVGNVGITTQESFTNQQINSVIPNKNIIDPKYLYYFFTGNKDYLTSLGGGGSVYTNISKSKFESMAIVVPQLEEQNRISEILSSLDDKIELNRQINANLEKMASALFKRWFVDFEFPDEKGRPYKTSGGKMVETEMGEVPEGWRVGKVNDLMRVESGFPFNSGMFYDDGKYGLVTIKNVQDGFFVSNCTDHLDDIPSKMPEHCKLRAGDVLLSLTGNVGRVCIVIGENYLLNQRVAILIPVEKTNRAFTYLFFRQTDFQNTLINISRGTAQQNLSPIETKNLEIVVPTKEILLRFGEAAAGVFETMVNNLGQIETLSAVRDSLLPGLMRGRIRTI